MDVTDAAPVDPRLLVLFDEVYRQRSVSRAAERLGQGQSNASISLAKLRRIFDDALFVRTSAGMQPTPRAEALIGPTRSVLERLRRLPDPVPVFDPATGRREFRIAMTDASHIALLPRLLANLRAAGPQLGVEVVNITDRTARDLETGEADLALGYIPDLDAGFYQQTLFEQDYVCLVSATHPRIAKALTLKQYREEAHVALRLSGTGHANLDAELRRRRITRRVRLTLPGFLGLGAILSSTELIATLPRQIGELTALSSGTLRVLDCPVALPRFAIKQHWHARFHEDAGNRWLRQACAAALAGPARVGGARNAPRATGAG